MSKQKVVCFGPGPLFKGGISNYNTSLAKTISRFEDAEVTVVSWTQQYPAIVPRDFIDKASKEKFLNDEVPVHYLTNYNNPFTWRKTADTIIAMNPDKVVIQWYNAQQGLPLSFIVKRIKRKCKAEIIFDLHFVVPKENSSIDRFFTKMGLKHVDTFATHAYKTVRELKDLFPNWKYHETKTGNRVAGKKNLLLLYHPVYDIFKPKPDFDKEAAKKELNLRKHVFLFFGFIRKYKGLHQAIEAFNVLAQQRDDVSLLICGESFWNTLDDKKFSVKVKKALFGVVKKLFLKKDDDESNYRPLELVELYGLQDRVTVVNRFIPNEDVHKYFQVSDAVLLFYLTATPSGIESLSYNFTMPILAANVGHFPETITDGKDGYLAESGDIQGMAAIMQKSIEHPIQHDAIREKTKAMSWESYARVMLAD